MRARLALLTMAVVGQTACGENPPPPPTSLTPVSVGKQAFNKGTPSKTASKAPPYVYNPMGKRDPFRNGIEEGLPSSRESAACTEPLCQWELSQLTLVAVVTGEANPFGMVEDPQGKGYMVRRNAKVGKQGGRVTQILRDSVTVTEFWIGPDGKRSPNPIVMQMKQENAVQADIDLESGKPYP